MNKTQKRQLHIRNKLIAAVAMLLVSSIMMVSTTYAWFTLSTAPEVQGITTTVGANGNLEIALSPLSGESSELTSGMGDSNETDWLVKNLTWGNLLDLSDSDYKLDQIALMPALVNATGTTESDLVLSEFPLQTPTYGADGRVSGLEAQTYSGTMYEEGTDGKPSAISNFVANDYKGVRAVGTANSMSEYEATLNSSRSTLNSQIGKTQDYAEGSLNANGGVLLEMAILHASAGSDDSNDYSSYVPTLRSVVNSLTQAHASLEQAIRAAIRGVASTKDASNETTYNAVIAMLDNPENKLQTIWGTYGSLVDSTNPLAKAYSTWESIGTKLTTAESALQSAEAKVTAKTTVSWTDASAVLTNIMETSGTMTIGGVSLTQFKDYIKIWDNGENYDHDGDGDKDADDVAKYNEANTFVSSQLKGLNVVLGSGTGMYYDFATVVGDLDSAFEVNIAYAKADGSVLRLNGVPATMVTNYGGIGEMNSVKLALASATAIASDSSSLVLDETYGYIVDFYFRTNASGSMLKLQTTAAQRIYSDSSNSATMGNGSTMTFRTGSVSETTLQGLMESIRVVFFDPDSLEIYGVAKLDTTMFSRTVIVDNANGEDIVDVSAPLKLYTVTANNAGVLTFGAEKAEADATLCELPANTATAVSALVYLDGETVTNEDVASSGTSAVGTLNLQFSSDASLVPMTNTALKSGTGSNSYTVTFVNNTDATIVPTGTTAAPNSNYYFGLTGNGTYTVTYKVGESGSATTITGTTDPTSGGVLYTIPSGDVTDDIVITITSGDSTNSESGPDAT